MRRKAHAKLTLYLHVKDRLDGLLHFKNVIVPIDLFDMVYLEVNDVMHIETDKKYLPNDKRNTVYKAITLLKSQYNIQDNFKVRIVKNIPAQSGLGGGSADAACVINMINDLYKLNLSRQELIDVARQIDEDTPYCLFDEPTLVEGYGEILTPLQFNTALYYVLIKPGFGVSTKSFLKRFDRFSDTEEAIDQLISAMEEGNHEEIFKLTHNDFQKTVMKKNSSLKKVIKQLDSLGLEGICMSGSGTSIYGLTQDVNVAIKAFEKTWHKYPFVKYGKL